MRFFNLRKTSEIIDYTSYPESFLYSGIDSKIPWCCATYYTLIKMKKKIPYQRYFRSLTDSIYYKCPICIELKRPTKKVLANRRDEEWWYFHITNPFLSPDEHSCKFKWTSKDGKIQKGFDKIFFVNDRH